IPSSPSRPTQAKGRTLTHLVRGVGFGREKHPSGGHYCERIYIEITGSGRRAIRRYYDDGAHNIADDARFRAVEVDRKEPDERDPQRDQKTLLGYWHPGLHG
ncbi:MAG: hypothetical protein KJS68_03315, partial [Alphaproteobacteria bacterium]|nr:hypothetical protein [Alphaproteobacteria bacterium]